MRGAYTKLHCAIRLTLDCVPGSHGRGHVERFWPGLTHTLRFPSQGTRAAAHASSAWILTLPLVSSRPRRKPMPFPYDFHTFHTEVVRGLNEIICIMDVAQHMNVTKLNSLSVMIINWKHPKYPTIDEWSDKPRCSQFTDPCVPFKNDHE